MTSSASLPTMTSPRDWPWARSAASALSSDDTRWHGALLRRWSGTSSVMVQPALDSHYVVLHMGGSKRVTRRLERRPVDAIVECGALTIVPAGTAYVWKTEGPIAFAHLYVRPLDLELTARNSGSSNVGELFDCVGFRDPILEPIFRTLLAEAQCAQQSNPLLMDCLFESFCVRLSRRYGSAGSSADTLSLAPFRLRRVLEFIDANVGSPIALADLVRAAGTSQYHFSRAFHLAIGVAPYQYLLRRRVEHARILLMTTDETLSTIAVRSGFTSRAQLSTMFKQNLGATPQQFRRTARSGHRAAPRAVTEP